MKRILRRLVLLLVIVTLSAMSTSCVLIDRVQWTYTNFQCRELTDEEKADYGVSILDWAPYIYTCDVEISDKLEPGNGTKKGICYFVPYVDWNYNDYFATSSESGPPFGQITGTLKVKEMTKIEGTGYYGRTPFEVKNVEMAFLTGNYTRMGMNSGDVSYLDGNGTATMNHEYFSAHVCYVTGRKAAADETADEMLSDARKNRLSSGRALQKCDRELQIFDKSITGLVYRMKNDSQRLTIDEAAQEGHRFGAKIKLYYDKRIQSAKEKDFNIFLRTSFNVYNTVTKQNDVYDTEWVRVPYTLDLKKYEQ